MKHLPLFLLLFLYGVVHTQEVEQAPRVTHENQIKIGFSNQIDFVLHGYDDYYYGNDYYQEGGINTQLFLAYEHVWEFSNNTAIGLEPRIGASFKRYVNHGIAGLNTKFYWVNHKVWRMGIALYGGYGYLNRNVEVSVPMEGGNYYQVKDIRVHLHSFSFDIGLIPFQFRFENVPIVIESIISLGGFTSIRTKSERYDDYNYQDNYLNEFYTFPYFLKAEFKIGFVFPNGK